MLKTHTKYWYGSKQELLGHFPQNCSNKGSQRSFLRTKHHKTELCR